MAARPDDDALTWDGDDDPTLEVGKAAPSESDEPTDPPPDNAPLPEGWNAVGKGSDTVSAGETPAAASDSEESPIPHRGPMSNVTLVTVGILGGFYLLFTIGWVIGGFRLQGHARYLVTDIMFQGSFWLAVLAPALWFGTVFLLTRRSPIWVRVVWLVAGAILLVPWPFIMIGAVGQ